MVYARTLSGAGTSTILQVSEPAYSISTTGDIYTCFTNSLIIDAATNTKLCIAVLPSDGSLTGTYNIAGTSFTYSSGTTTSQTFNLPDLSFTTSSGTATETNTSYTAVTDAASSLTLSKVVV